MKKYKITIWGYGGELTIGSVDADLKEAIKKNKKKFSTWVSEKLEDWYEYDDQLHQFGAMDTYEVTIEDDKGKNIHQFSEKDFRYGSTMVERNYAQIDQTKDLICCLSEEKGTFFEGDLELEEDFDLSKFKIKVLSNIHVGRYNMGSIITDVLYDGVSLDNYGGETDCKVFSAYKSFKREPKK